MMRVLIILFILKLLNAVIAQAQDFYLFQDGIKKVNDKIENMYDKSDCRLSDELKIYNVLHVIYDDEFKKKEFLDGSFLNKIKPSFYYKKDKKDLLRAESLLCNSKSELIAISDGYYIYCLANYKEEAYLSKKMLVKSFKDLNAERIFYINLTPPNIYFVLTNNLEIFVLEILGNTINSYPIDHYVNNHWEKFVNYDE